MASSPTCITDATALVVADASTIINLNATGKAADLLAAFPNRVAVVDVIPGELASGRSRGWPDADLLNELLDKGVLDVVTMSETAAQRFEQLVIGSAAMTLGDGEAATIAYSVVNGAIAVLDERKARRICAERFTNLRMASTVDLFAHPEVQRQLDSLTLADMVFDALSKGRMRVLPHHFDWVIRLVGEERAAKCCSLPFTVRQQYSQAGRS